MSDYSNKVLRVFNSHIDTLASEKNSRNLVNNIYSDFTRNRKLSFQDLMKIIIFSAAKPIKEELWDYFDYDANTASSSAFVQARDKLNSTAFKELFYLLNSSFPCRKLYNGYQLLGVDGSDLSIPLDLTDADTLTSCGSNLKQMSQYHIDSAYDLLEHRYVDMIITGCKNKNEPKSLVSMAESHPKDNVIYIADRYYATWNTMAHIMNANKSFVIRSKDIESKSSLLKKFNLPNEEFDVDVHTILTKKQTKEIRSQPDTYRFISTTTTFDYIETVNDEYPIGFRVVRFKANGDEEYESILTNLSREEFPATAIKELYKLRWGIEVSFRHLKYATALKVLHSKKRNSIQQEIWAKAILYNLSMLIINKTCDKVEKRRKWEYKINLTSGIHLIREMIKRKGGFPPSFKTIISKELLPIRPNRQNERNVRIQRTIGFNYRFS
ncbi:DDE family transposase [Breznakia blatticola]|uniref:DDE family transposase n=1 Tax=Breznakia blatticola TaxID=1754012 RepID=A0A4R8A484_9FIRM|nr:IS4 family transposase [Breznakia blatticola]TDW25312.1 DDE family transposase [Breznakia blatticola]